MTPTHPKARPGNDFPAEEWFAGLEGAGLARDLPVNNPAVVFHARPPAPSRRSDDPKAAEEVD